MTSQLAITHPFEIVTVAKNIVNLYKQNMKRNIVSHVDILKVISTIIWVSLNPVYDSTSQPIIYFLPRQKVLKKHIKKLSTSRFEDRYFMLKDKPFTLKQLT
jgi:hypothetical protein